MLEILFSDSACGSLKVAQHYGKGIYQGGSIGIIGSHTDGSKPTKKELKVARQEAEEKARFAWENYHPWENAIPLGGNSADIYGFPLVLSIGDISENPPSIKRKQTLEHLYSVYPNDVGHQAAQEIFKKADTNLKAVRERAAKGESLRIWYSNQPDEMCGLYWFLNQLHQWNVPEGQTSMVMLPQWEADDKGNIVQKCSWGEVALGEWHRYLAFQRPVLPVFIQSCSAHWRELQEENAPLRAVLNGQLVSVSEDTYDCIILREIAEEGEMFQEAMLIGRVLGKYQLGIGDAWVALRIEEMIHAGKLEVMSAVTEDMPIYHRMLKKCSHILNPQTR